MRRGGCGPAIFAVVGGRSQSRATQATKRHETRSQPEMYEDKQLVCVQCEQEFVLTAGEQEDLADKGFTNQPKRCMACRQKRRRRRKKPEGQQSRGQRFRGQQNGQYRSPAFENSAPQSQRSTRRGGSSNKKPSQYRSPAFRDARHGQGEYRSPAFREMPTGESEYRAPGFRDAVVAEADEYRAPGFQDSKGRYHDERPMFVHICPECGEKLMVPDLPEELEEQRCDDCMLASQAVEEPAAEEQSVEQVEELTEDSAPEEELAELAEEEELAEEVSQELVDETVTEQPTQEVLDF